VRKIEQIMFSIAMNAYSRGCWCAVFKLALEVLNNCRKRKEHLVFISRCICVESEKRSPKVLNGGGVFKTSFGA